MPTKTFDDPDALRIESLAPAFFASPHVPVELRAAVIDLERLQREWRALPERQRVRVRTATADRAHNAKLARQQRELRTNIERAHFAIANVMARHAGSLRLAFDIALSPRFEGLVRERAMLMRTTIETAPSPLSRTRARTRLESDGIVIGKTPNEATHVASRTAMRDNTKQLLQLLIDAVPIVPTVHALRAPARAHAAEGAHVVNA